MISESNFLRGFPVYIKTNQLTPTATIFNKNIYLDKAQSFTGFSLELVLIDNFDVEGLNNA